MLKESAMTDEIHLLARWVAKLKDEGLDVIDLTGSCFSRQIQPLKFRGDRLLCQITGERNDPLRVSEDNLALGVLDSHLRKMMKIKPSVTSQFSNK
jgi:hypothetical protein